jgi:hypothetical protein
MASNVWYRAPIAYVRPIILVPAETAEYWEKYEYAGKIAEYANKGQVCSAGLPFDQQTPGYTRGKVVLPFIQAQRADWYNHDDDTCVCVLHPGLTPPAGWEGPLDRATFLQHAEAAGYPSISNAQAAWPEEVA